MSIFCKLCENEMVVEERDGKTFAMCPICEENYNEMYNEWSLIKRLQLAENFANELAKSQEEALGEQTEE